MRHRSLEGWSAVNTGSNYTPAELAFLMAVDRYKRESHRPFPTCREILAIICSLGYRLVAEPAHLPHLEEIKDSVH